MLNYSDYTIECIREKLEKYIKDNNIKSLILGVSGGIDSAVCAALAKPVCNYLNIPLIGRSLPIDTNKKEEIDRAILIGTYFCTDFNDVDLSKVYTDVVSGFEACDFSSSINNRIQLGNIKARLRMMYLYDLANKHKGMVLSTDNLTEYYLGFWTLHGDVGDFGMIQSLWKTEVYQIANFMLLYDLQGDGEIDAMNKCIQATPTDGLGITDSDLDQIGAKSYTEVDMVLQDFIKYEKSKDCPIYDTPIVQRYLRTHFKRNNPFNLKRDDII